jgi:error-prone DNA polymerase
VSWDGPGRDTQRSATAAGVTFLNDETGVVNVIFSRDCFIRSKRTITSSAALIIRGRVERSQGVTNLVADKIERLPIAMRSASRDWR